jgi:hypothetical protein
MAQYTLPYIKTPLFVSNSLADSWQLSNIMDLGCDPASNKPPCSAQQLAYFVNFRQVMINALSPLLSSPTQGAFLQTCETHVVEDTDGSWNRTLVAGQTQAATFLSWYNGDNSKSHQAVDCAWPCNKSC